MAYRQRLGRWGENVGRQYLISKGLVFLAQNLRSRYGEIDLVMQDGSTIVFVEVKTRTSRAFGMPEESITAQKQLHLIQAAELCMQEHPEWGENWRIDVLAIFGRARDPAPEITWFENAVG